MFGYKIPPESFLDKRSMAPTKTKLHFSRFEFKYVLPRPLMEQFEGELQYFVQLDPFVEQQENNVYLVRSLYFDGPEFEAYYDKLDGLRTREKFRLRTYATGPEEKSPRFLEIKGRHNNLVFKHRSPLSERKFDTSSSGEHIADSILSALDAGELKDRFTYFLLRKRIEPVILIDYVRRPYISKYDPEFRVTFDSDLAATRSDCLFPGDRSITRKLIPGYCVMEVKFRFHLPSWFHRLLQSWELERTSISKVCTGIKAWNLVPDLS